MKNNYEGKDVFPVTLLYIPLSRKTRNTLHTLHTFGIFIEFDGFPQEMKVYFDFLWNYKPNNYFEK